MMSYKPSKGTSHRTVALLRAMTLVEILAVVVILGLVAGTLLIGFSGSFGKAKHELAKSGIGIIASQPKSTVLKMETGRAMSWAWQF